MHRERSFLSLLVLLYVPLAPSMTLGAETIEEIEACVQANFPDDSSIQEIAMHSFDEAGEPTALPMEAKIYWKMGENEHSQVLMEFDNPPDLRGSSLLMLEKEGRNDMFMYLPEFGRVRRVTSQMASGSMFGTDFSYEDFERLQGIADDAPGERAPDEEVAGRPAYAIDHRPAEDGDSDYERVRSLVDRETCVPLRMEFFGKGNELRKVLETDFSKVTKEATGWMPRELSMNDVSEGTRTTLSVKSIEVNADIPRKMFTQSQLERRR